MKLSFTAFFVVMLLASPTYAQVEDIPPGEDVIEPIKKGEKSPFDGQIFSNDTALRWASWLKQYKTRLALDVEHEREACKVETTYRDRLLTVEEERSGRVEKDLQDRLTRSEEARLKAEEYARNPPFYATTEFGVVMGVLASAGVFALSTWAVSQLAQ